jgi:membrane associated rhomboid family serine protease
VNAGAVAATASTTGGGVAFAAHVVGFVGGMLGVFVFRKREVSAWDH